MDGIFRQTHGEAMAPEDCPDVVFATPSLSHSVCKAYFRSMTQTGWLLKAHGLRHGHMDRDGDQFIAKARNKLFADFLAQFPATQNFFFIDDDVGWPPEKIIEFLQRPEDVVCGAYPKKCDEVDFPMSLAASDGQLIEQNGLLMAVLAPAGFMRVKRHVIERLSAGAPTFVDLDPDGSERRYPCVFESGPGPDGWWWGEDYTFCQKWRAMGGQVWIDPNIEFTHAGLKTWKGTMADHLPFLRAKALQEYAARGLREVAGNRDAALAGMIEAELSGDRRQDWNQDPAELDAFVALVKELGVKSYLEIGSRNGGSFWHVMQAIGKGGRGLSIDLAENRQTEANLRRTIAELRADGIEADVIFGNSQAPEVIARAREAGPFDLVLIDGDHRYSGVAADFDAYGKLGRVVAVHDVAAPEGWISDGHINEVGRFWRNIRGRYSYREIVTPGSNMGFGVILGPAEMAEAAE